MSSVQATAQDVLTRIKNVEQELSRWLDDHDEQIETLEERVDTMESRLTELQLRVSELDEDRAYTALSRDEKVGIVRRHAYRRARKNDGKVDLDVEGVRWGAFDGEPSRSHCYELMDDAGRKWAGEGFTYRTETRGEYALRVDAETVRSEAPEFSETTRQGEGGGGR